VSSIWSTPSRSPLHRELLRFSSSLEADQQLFAFDIAGSLAHVRGLRAAGLITQGQLSQLERGLRHAAKILDASTLSEDEDIHSAVERVLGESDPDAAARLQTGRSRNDQVALDLRLFCRHSAPMLIRRLLGLIDALADQARAHADWPMPGYTHLQRAQPVPLGLHLLAHAEALLRDAVRVLHAYESADVMPLGAGALAGSTLPLQREVVARELGFSRLARNSMDAVSDRDFILDLLYACLTIGLHLSRLGEDLVLWSTAEFGFLRLRDEIATGSSLMPQKKNPDIAELVRGRSGRALGALVQLATVLKGLPLTYNRDLQEDKTALFGGLNNAVECLDAMTLVVERLRFNRERLADAVSDPDLLATDSAEKLVAEGLPFRQAYIEVGEAVRAGKHTPPWDARESLKRRRLQVRAQARALAREAAALGRWAASHPPPLPL